ncbi:GNAT family N-acetyltransferase [Pseudomonas capsici]|uniref:GNAT family N-acetyltransferase n=1 Tax=Pseudomonas capsici TaxID=2810614 RepID=UPI0019101CDF|nr:MULTISPECIES: GNAT family N-acetyltransferase [Pseudomonas]MCV4342045.1 GNAT family N-acetyltransferase [Pseudomonas capsici]GFM51259.1 acetyltransferase [Pseudomonas cichorii]
MNTVTSDPISDNPYTPDLRFIHWVEELNDGTHLLIRPIQEDDRQRAFEFLTRLSPQTQHFRFLSPNNEPAPLALDQIMDTDYQQRMTYVALVMEDNNQLSEIGLSHYAATEGDYCCECAVVVADKWQDLGLGKLLMQHLMNAARLNGFYRMFSIDSVKNARMFNLARSLGFECHPDPLERGQVVYKVGL